MSQAHAQAQAQAQARTTPRIHAEIKASTASVQALALRYNVTAPTTRKWRVRDDVRRCQSSCRVD